MIMVSIDFKSWLNLKKNRKLVRFTSTGSANLASAQPKVAKNKAAKDSKSTKAVESTSFAMNLFRGQLKLDEVFPFPNALNDEQRETLQALVDPTAKFFEEKNNALENDKLEKVPDHIMQGLKELGAFGKHFFFSLIYVSSMYGFKFILV